MTRLFNFLFVAALLLFAAKTGSAQGSCGTQEALQRILQDHPEYLQVRAAQEQFIREHANTAQERLEPVITIPVVVHVVWYSGVPAQNISDAQINSQLAVLNADFRKLNTDVFSVPSYFSGLVADVQVEFCLAKRTPDCQPTNGITRTMSSTATWGTDGAITSTSSGGADAWDRDQYLNIWVGDLVGGLNGYARYPGVGSAASDGVVIDYKAFGTTGTALAPHHRGRVATHEVGHWLNLIHIFGEDDPNGGACSGSDFVDDTPTQATLHEGCPDGIIISCGNGPNGDMYMNYMDYVDDICMHMFTEGQKKRMRATLDGFRSSLKTSKGCEPLGDCDFLPPVTLANISGPSLLCTTGSKVYGTFTSNIVDYKPECMEGVWSVSWPGGLQIVNQVVADDGTTNALIKALAPGTYTVRFTVTLKSCQQTVYSKSYTVQVCALPSAPISVPPPGLNLICSFNDPECYTFNNNCGLSFLVSTSDPYLIATVSGATICLSSNYYKRRTSRLSVTPINSCGQGVKATWYIDIDHSEDCYYLAPPNGPGANEALRQPENDPSGYVVVNAGNQIRIEDRSVEPGLLEKNIQLLSLDGRLLIDYATEDAWIQIDLNQDYPAGIYLLRIVKGGQVYSKKIIVRH